MLLGASDDGAVEGIPEASALDIERSISNVTSNPNLFKISRWSSSSGCMTLKAGSSYGFGFPWDRPPTRSTGSCTAAWWMPTCA